MNALRRGDIVVYEPPSDQKSNWSNPKFKGCVGVVSSVDLTSNNSYGQPAARVQWFIPPSDAEDRNQVEFFHVASNLRLLFHIEVDAGEVVSVPV